jgi:protein-tyrosine phosphatase
MIKTILVVCVGNICRSPMAQYLIDREISGADLILAMEAAHKYEIMRRHPGASGKVFRLGEIGRFDVPDPYTKPIEHFYDAFELIRIGVDAWAPRIKAMA